MKRSIQSWLHTARIIIRNLRKRKYEPEMPFMQRFLRSGDTCLHIGSSDGRHTVMMSALVGHGHIFCFEPSIYTTTIFKRVMWFHRVRNASVYNMAVADAPGRTNLITPVKSSGHLGRSFAFLADDVPDVAELRRTRGFLRLYVDPIEVCTVDGFCRDHAIDSVQFIRCDVEGAEILVLRGAREVLQRDRPILMLEVHPHSLRDHFDSSAEQLRDELSAYGYRFFMVEGDDLKEVDAFIDEPWRDYFCLPADASVGAAA